MPLWSVADVLVWKDQALPEVWEVISHQREEKDMKKLLIALVVGALFVGCIAILVSTGKDKEESIQPVAETAAVEPTVGLPEPMVNTCPQDDLLTYMVESAVTMKEATDIVTDAANSQSFSDFVPLHNRMVKVRKDAGELYAPPCAVGIQSTLLQALDASADALAAGEIGDVDTVTSKAEEATALLKFMSEQTNQLGQDLGLPGY